MKGSDIKVLDIFINYFLYCSCQDIFLIDTYNDIFI